MARPELVLAVLLVGLTCGVLLLWPAQSHVPALLKVLGAWVGAFGLWIVYITIEWAIYERRRKAAGEHRDSSKPH